MGRYSRSASRSRTRERDRGSGAAIGSSGGGSSGALDGYDADQDGYRVHVADLGIDCSQKEIERVFKKYGETKEIWLARNPPCFAFIVYKHKADGEEAIREMDGRVVAGSRVRVSWARPRTRGRNRRFDPNMRCYQCGERGHFSRDCDRGGYRNYRRGDNDYDDYKRRRR